MSISIFPNTSASFTDHRVNQTASLTTIPMTINGAVPPAGTYLLTASAYINGANTGSGNITFAAAWTLPNTQAVTLNSGGLWSGALSLAGATGAQPTIGTSTQSGAKVIELDGTTTPTYTITYSATGAFDSTVCLVKLR